MLHVVESHHEKRKTQRLLEVALQKLPRLGTQRVIFRPSFVDIDLYGHGDGRLYFGAREIDEGRKYWNSFGIFDGSRSGQRITIEINIRLDDGRTEGFFAKDEIGHLYLMHSGRPGGGKQGVSRENFLAWLKPELLPVSNGIGATRAGIVIGRLDAPNLPDRIEHFVAQVRSFKDAVDAGEVDNAAFQQKAAKWADYRKEFSGRKTGAVNVDLDYVSFHGDVVDALKVWVESRLDGRAKTTNSPLIDLLVHRGRRLTDVYEVKTSGARQVLYTAIGQLMVHSANESQARRHLVLPEDSEVPDDVALALRVGSINVQRFQIIGGKTVKIIA
ncbi:hypothetical protein X760_27760 [Mesorhizobium sp. LSHC422A00]|uniref:hypothetical protein n=1 Tax=Mesorhizobium sp. LSHC422A00 TaxID=1287294 RepID=UPI0003CF6E1C|nr:hypothetical protein [Mesorhizobium sp. LSHC422A00]ESX54721.1 hypothetical protein X760_27760 [Mesorhizobium sp. LSHC422A00]